MVVVVGGEDCGSCVGYWWWVVVKVVLSVGGRGGRRL